MTEKASPPLKLVLVTGPSGAGRSTAIHALEDIGFESIDNLPLRLVPRLLDGPGPDRPMALGTDARNRDFSVGTFHDVVDDLREGGTVDLTVLFLDCRAEVLLRRFSETRRRHPLAPSENPEAGVARELDLLAPIRDRADILIDTSELNVHQLREEIEHWFAPQGAARLALSVQSFSYKRGLPRAIDMVFDCRFLSNPHWQPELRPLDGRDAPVADYVRSDPLFDAFFEHVRALTELLLPAFVREGKSHLTIAFGCTGGRHRSVALAENLAKALAESGQQVSIRHRELEGRGPVGRLSQMGPESKS